MSPRRFSQLISSLRSRQLCIRSGLEINANGREKRLYTGERVRNPWVCNTNSQKSCPVIFLFFRIVILSFFNSSQRTSKLVSSVKQSCIKSLIYFFDFCLENKKPQNDEKVEVFFVSFSDI